MGLSYPGQNLDSVLGGRLSFVICTPDAVPDVNSIGNINHEWKTTIIAQKLRRSSEGDESHYFRLFWINSHKSSRHWSEFLKLIVVVPPPHE